MEDTNIMNETNVIKNEMNNVDSWNQSASEIAKNSILSFSLEGWSAAATLISIPVAAVIIYAIKTLAYGD